MAPVSPDIWPEASRRPLQQSPRPCESQNALLPGATPIAGSAKHIPVDVASSANLREAHPARIRRATHLSGHSGQARPLAQVFALRVDPELSQELTFGGEHPHVPVVDEQHDPQSLVRAATECSDVEGHGVAQRDLSGLVDPIVTNPELTGVTDRLS